jgi:hypothetical protein
MSLANLEGKTLEPVSPDKASIARLLEGAERSLNDARLPGISNEGAFDMAYKAIMQTANAALQAYGYRTLTSQPGHHQTMIQTLPQTIGLEVATMIQLDALRKQRNNIDYSGEVVSGTMSNVCLRHAAELLHRTRQWLATNKPHLL